MNEFEDYLRKYHQPYPDIEIAPGVVPSGFGKLKLLIMIREPRSKYANSRRLDFNKVLDKTVIEGKIDAMDFRTGTLRIFFDGESLKGILKDKKNVYIESISYYPGLEEVNNIVIKNLIMENEDDFNSRSDFNAKLIKYVYLFGEIGFNLIDRAPY